MSLQCPVCGSSDVKKSEYLSNANSAVEYYTCSACFHRFQNTNSASVVEDDSETVVLSKEELYKFDRNAQERIRFYKDKINESDNFLEVGSTIGSFVHLLRLMGKNAEGIELDGKFGRFSDNQYGFTQYIGDFPNYSFDTQFDAVFSFYDIENVKSVERFCSKINEVLNQNGKLLIEVSAWEMRKYGGIKNVKHFFSIASLYKTVTKLFTLLDIGYFGTSIYIYAEKQSDSGFEEKVFSKLKKTAVKTERLLKLTPQLKFKNNNVTQIALQAYLQKELKPHYEKLKLFAKYGLKELNYVKKERKKGNANQFTHLTYYRGWENSGDTILSKCVRDVYNTDIGNISWNLQRLTDPVGDELISQINNSKAVVLGGGGVLIPDTNKNSTSGWQWAVSKEQLKQIESPLFLYAIGYNYFPNQVPSDFFIDNLKHVVDKASFIGLRNNGSIKKVSELVGDRLAKKLTFQPCPTTIIRHLYPELKPKVKSKNVAINIAYDRYERRFGEDIYEIHDQLALTCKELERQGYTIYNACHLNADGKFELALDKHNVAYKTVYLNFQLPLEVYDFYNNMELVMGMRGHAQMIPFGINCKIISLGTHDKMRWFLEDIDAIDWYVNLREDVNSLKERVVEKAIRLLNEDGSVTEQLLSKQQIIVDQTKKNIDAIKMKLS